MNNQTYDTNDIYLTSYLIASDKCHLKSIESFEGWKKTFVLTPIPSNEDISSFYSGSAMVSALKLSNQLRSLKAACMSNKGGCNE